MSEVKQVVSSPVVSGVSRVVARSPVSPFLLVVVVVVLLLPSLSYYYYSPLSLILFSLSLLPHSPSTNSLHTNSLPIQKVLHIRIGQNSRF